MLPHGFKVQGGMLAITPFFAGREEQLVCAQVVVDNGHSGGRRRLCVDAGVQLYRQDLEETAKTLQIKLRFTNGETTVDTRHSGDLAVPRGEHLNFCSSPRVFGNSSIRYVIAMAESADTDSDGDRTHNARHRCSTSSRRHRQFAGSAGLQRDDDSLVRRNLLP
jgi:hypothetical protein